MIMVSFSILENPVNFDFMYAKEVTNAYLLLSNQQTSFGVVYLETTTYLEHPCISISCREA